MNASDTSGVPRDHEQVNGAHLGLRPENASNVLRPSAYQSDPRSNGRPQLPGYNTQSQVPMTNHHPEASSSSDLPPAYDGTDGKSSAYYNLGKGSIPGVPMQFATQRSSSGRSLPVPPGQSQSFAASAQLGGEGSSSGLRNTSGPRPLPVRPGMQAPVDSFQSGSGRDASSNGNANMAQAPKPRKPLPTTPGFATTPQSAQYAPSQSQQIPPPLSSPPPTGYPNGQQIFPSVPFMSPGSSVANSLPIMPPPASPLPTMQMFPPAYMYNMPPMGLPGPDAGMYQSLPPAMGMNLGMGMMSYPSYYPPGYMPPGWNPAPPAAPAGTMLSQAQAAPMVSPPYTQDVAPSIDVASTRRPAPISVSDANAVGYRDPGNLTPKPFMQNNMAADDGHQGYFPHNRNIGAQAATGTSVARPQNGDGRNLAADSPFADPTQQAATPLYEMARHQTTRKGRGMEYLQSLAVSQDASQPGNTELTQHTQWPSANPASRQDVVHSNGVATEPSPSPPVEMPAPYPNHSHSQAHRESTVSIPHTIQSLGEGPSHAYERLARVPSLAPSWISHAREGGRPPARWVQNKLFLHQSHAEGREGGGLDPDFTGDSYWDGDMDGDGMYRDEEEDSVEEENEMNFFMPSLESHVAVQLRDRVERNTHIKGGISWPASFTGRDVVVRRDSHAISEWIAKNPLSAF